MNKKHQNTYSNIILLLIGIVIFICTFPTNDWSYSVGIDPSLKWAFNHLFSTGLEKGKEIIFPHGPLAFFMYPMPDNILLATAVTGCLKMLMIFNFYWLLKDYNKNAKWSFVVVLSFLFALVAGFNQLLLINIILLYCNFYVKENFWLKLTAFTLTAFAFYIRAYVAILSAILFISFAVYYLYKNRNLKQLIYDGGLVFGFVLLLWVIMYQSLEGFLWYLMGMIQLASDNSSAAAYYPYNNWWAIAIYGLIVLLVFLINKSKKRIFFVWLILFSLFAAWKHGMARLDIFHAKGFLIYSGICLIIFSLFIKKKLVLNLALSIFALVALSVNLKNSVNYFPQKFDFKGAIHFYEFTSSYKALKEESQRISKGQTKENRLSDGLAKIIGNSTVDIYPWDYSVIPANNLNWQPRIVIQSYAAYTSWLDNKNQAFFQSENAPEFILWEKDKISRDVNGGELSSIDNRYLLNDEPQTLLQFLCRYEFAGSDDKFLLLKKCKRPIKYASKVIGENRSEWGQWVKVPESGTSLLRAKPDFGKPVLQSLKSFFYKDEQFWIYLKMEDGLIHKYRIVPKNAKDGLWINPYLVDFDKAYKVKEIMIVASNQRILAKEIDIIWEEIELTDHPNGIYNFFNVERFQADSLMLRSVNTYENQAQMNWNQLNEEQLDSKAFGGTKSHLIKANSYSSTFSMPLDSLDFNSLKIVAECWVNTPDYKRSKNISIIVDVTHKSGERIWHGIPVDDQLIDQKKWNHVFSSLEIEHLTPGSKLSVYLWNTSDDAILLDDFSVSVLENCK